MMFVNGRWIIAVWWVHQNELSFIYLDWNLYFGLHWSGISWSGSSLTADVSDAQHPNQDRLFTACLRLCDTSAPFV